MVLFDVLQINKIFKQILLLTLYELYMYFFYLLADEIVYGIYKHFKSSHL